MTRERVLEGIERAVPAPRVATATRRGEGRGGEDHQAGLGIRVGRCSTLERGPMGIEDLGAPRMVGPQPGFVRFGEGARCQPVGHTPEVRWQTARSVRFGPTIEVEIGV